MRGGLKGQEHMYTYDWFTMYCKVTIFPIKKKKESGTHNQCWRSLEDTEEDICIGQLIRFPGWSRWISVMHHFQAQEINAFLSLSKVIWYYMIRPKGSHFMWEQVIEWRLNSRVVGVEDESGGARDLAVQHWAWVGSCMPKDQRVAHPSCSLFCSLTSGLAI